MDLSNVGMGALFIAVFMTMFSLANPILAASLLVGITPGWSKREQKPCHRHGLLDS